MSILRNVETGKEVLISSITGFGMTVTEDRSGLPVVAMDSDSHAKVYTPVLPSEERMGLVGIESSTPSKFEIDFGPFCLSFDAVVQCEDNKVEMRADELVCAVLKVYKKSDPVLSEKH